MNNHNLVIYEFEELYKIFLEIEKDINLNFEKANNQQLTELNSRLNCLIFTKREIEGLDNQMVFNKFPISIFELLEKINIEFIKKNFHEQSDIKIGNYNLNLNSRKMSFGEINLKLTEKEISSILYLFTAERSVKIQELQLKVWGYQSELETHTVETHIYRLRKKILKMFRDENFIISKKNGYEIQKKKINLQGIFFLRNISRE